MAAAVRMTVPLIDLEPLAGAPAERQAVARAIDDACRDIGFFAVQNHGVPADVADTAWDKARAFFDLALAERQAVAFPYAGYPYGYAAFAGETLSLSLGHEAPPDLKETFSIGPIGARPPGLGDDPDLDFHYAANLWPGALPEMRPAWEAYYRVMGDLAARLMQGFALALDLDTDFFADKIDHHSSALRANHYPEPKAPPRPGQLRAGAHSDYGSLTILRQEAAPGGLEIKGPDGAWHPVPHVADAFVINIGDLMARWTNDRWVSTLHRVVNPPPDATGSTRRQSLAFFHQPNWDAVVECIPTCLALGGTPKYQPVGAGAHLMAKFRSTVGADA